MQNGHEWMQVIRQDAYVLVTCQSHIQTYQGPISRKPGARPYHPRVSTIHNGPLLTCRVHGFMRLSPYLYTSNSFIQLETRLVRPGNVYPVINSPMSVLTDPGEA
ncbi:uncharacterized protein TNCV_5117131 [Trichonephila clavipes]|nr:uncharacterized protein TNCV_5117131 [Trichonephila clavipes]